MPKSKRSRQAARSPNSCISGLTVDEFLLVDAAGFVAVGLVAGGSVFHVGGRAGWPDQGQELEMVTRALYGARRSALQQLETQAQGLGANGIIDLRLEIEGTETEAQVLQITGYGTAIRGQGAGTPQWTRGTPFSTTLSGQDFWALLRGGYQPLRLVMGSCTYQAGQTGTSPLASLPLGGKNMEVSALTGAVYDARERALQRMEEEARACQAEGIVGVDVEVRHNNSGGTYFIEFYALGTAIVASRAGGELPPPSTAIDLRL